jgi:hypothetical protein
MGAWLVSNPRNALGRHRYSSADLGLTEKAPTALFRRLYHSLFSRAEALQVAEMVLKWTSYFVQVNVRPGVPYEFDCSDCRL